ncbi:MAG TPA: hypothetical protein VLF91_02175 [Candidatus Saccharimonadales bacterium]|nr:hypothetical protein [Candidatus Saccharimonadales bacterium]
MRFRYPRTKTVALLSVIFICAVLIALGIALIGFQDKRTLPDRLTLSVNQHVLQKGIFTKQKLIAQHEDNAFNLNGDFTINGIFQLSQAETKSLMTADAVLQCTPNSDCVVGQQYSSDRAQLCTTATEQKTDKVYTLCTSPSTNQASWSYTSY